MRNRKVEYGMSCTAYTEDNSIVTVGGGCKKCDYYVDSETGYGDMLGCPGRYVVCSYLTGNKNKEMKLKRLVLEKTCKPYQCIHISELIETGACDKSLIWLTKQPQFEKHMIREDIVKLLKDNNRTEDLKWLNQYFPIKDDEEEVVYDSNKHKIVLWVSNDSKCLLFLNSNSRVQMVTYSISNKIDQSSTMNRDFKEDLSNTHENIYGEYKYYAIETDEQLAWVFKNYFSIEGGE